VFLKMAEKGLFEGIFGNNGWLMFLIFVLLVIGCNGGCGCGRPVC
jgi:hypothetical protein